MPRIRHDRIVTTVKHRDFVVLCSNTQKKRERTRNQKRYRSITKQHTRNEYLEYNLDLSQEKLLAASALFDFHDVFHYYCKEDKFSQCSIQHYCMVAHPVSFHERYAVGEQ